MTKNKKQQNSFIDNWKQKAKKLKKETYALYLAVKDPRTPWYAKAFAGFVVANAFSPIDLVPDFIPILGYLDDLILIPLGIALSIRMIPAEVLEESRQQAETAFTDGKPVSRAGAAAIIVLWLVLAALAIHWLIPLISK